MQLWSQFPKELLRFNCFCSQTLDIQHFSIAASQYRDYTKYDKHSRNNTNSTQRNPSTQSAKILLWAQWYKKLARSRTFRFSVLISCFTSLFLVAIHFRIATKLTKTAALSLGSADTQPPSQHITSSPCFHWWCTPPLWNESPRSAAWTSPGFCEATARQTPFSQIASTPASSVSRCWISIASAVVKLPHSFRK